MTLVLHNTMTRRKEPFSPRDPQHVTMYVCGPTVYNYAHIGNARAAVAFDVLYRVLKALYPRVSYARNITDIDDKIIKAAEETGEPIGELTARFTRIYHADMAALGVLEPDHEPRATDHIASMEAMIDRLITAGYAYAAEGHVLFHVPAFDAYGALSGRDRDAMIAGARVEVAPYKKDPADFVLWKPSTDDQPGWESPWGRGRPGWHLECSCMIESLFGITVDIHGGGHDLIFPHHENEIAQSTCAHEGQTFARFWVHNGFVNVDAEKMSKSLGNVQLVHDLLQQAPGEAIRLALISAQYRQPLDWTDDALAAARKRLDGFYGTLRRLADVEAGPAEVPDPVMAALLDDLNTPKALAKLSAMANAANASDDPAEQARLKGGLLAAGALMGLLQQDPEAWFTTTRSDSLGKDEIEDLLRAREDARKTRDFARADAIRQQLLDARVVIEDTPDGPVWRYSE